MAFKKIRIAYNVGNSSLKPARNLIIGQWWLYRDSKSWDWPEIPDDVDSLITGLGYVKEKICAVAITDIIAGHYGVDEIKVKFMVADPKYSVYKQLDVVWFVDQNFSAEEGCFTPLWDVVDGFVYKNDVISVAKQYGVDCTKCNKHYPHAVRSNDFECWSCKNGY